MEMDLQAHENQQPHQGRASGADAVQGPHASFPHIRQAPLRTATPQSQRIEVPDGWPASLEFHRTTSPVAVFPKDYPNGCVIAEHSHSSSQLHFASEGVMTVTTSSGMWVVPRNRAVWIPAHTKHSMQACGNVSLRMVFIQPDARTDFPTKPCVVNISPLLRELILRLSCDKHDAEARRRPALIAQLLLDELEWTRLPALHVAIPTHPRLLCIYRSLLADIASDRSVEEWAAHAAMSRRTLNRLCHQQTGMAFNDWRQQIRLLQALRLIAAGAPITSVALDLGYQSPSAFTNMFRRYLGTTPSDYFKLPQDRLA